MSLKLYLQGGKVPRKVSEKISIRRLRLARHSVCYPERAASPLIAFEKQKRYSFQRKTDGHSVDVLMKESDCLEKTA